jgi:chromosome partitioning protein
MEAKIISCLNLKGGVGKSTIITNLASVFKEKNFKPILIDLDSQQSVAKWYSQGNKSFGFSVFSIFLDLEPKEILSIINQFILDEQATHVFIDCPPQLAKETFIAALISDLVLVPITPSPFDLWAAEESIETIKEARKEKGSQGIPKALLVPSKVFPNTVLGKSIKKSLKKYGEPIAPFISNRIALPESIISGMTIVQYAPSSPSYLEFINLFKCVKTHLR